MDEMIYNPLEEYFGKYQNQHSENANAFFNELVKQSGIDVEANRKTVSEYQQCVEGSVKIKKSLNRFRFLRVLLCITIIGIPLVIWKITPKIKSIRNDLENTNKRAEELMAEAVNQTAPLNALFTNHDALDLIVKTIPHFSFGSYFSAEKEANMRINYGFNDMDDTEQSTIDVLYGEYKENPFLFEDKLIHQMGTQTYHGSLEISWTETYTDSDGKSHTEYRSETLHAEVTKPKPFYHRQIVLNYCAQGGPELSFSRSASHVEDKSEKEIQRYVKKGERKLKKLTNKALKDNTGFQSMSNSQFEVLFNATDRTNEVQYRTLFTPLAQTNMVSLLRSRDGYGDDFDFIKRNRTNKIVSEHSIERALNLIPSDYLSYSYDVIRDNFINKNIRFFKDVYFDFAPVLSIPIYQERPIHALMPIPESDKMVAQDECESLANAANDLYVVHPNTKTPAIVKSRYIETRNGIEYDRITAYSYDIFERTDYVSVYGDDGDWHDVPVDWDEYVPLERTSDFYVKSLSSLSYNDGCIAARNGIGIFNK